MTIWFATGNIHKQQELSAILPGHRIRVPEEAGIDFDPEETGSTFGENALIKARELYELLREPVIADDSGICVDALGGKPGIYSARYGSEKEGGEKLLASDRNALLLKELGDNPRRSARFVCAMVLMLNRDRYYLVQETLEGEVVPGVDQIRGEGGFGYDPLLYIPSQGCTVAQLKPELKNRISHRAKAGALISRILESLEP